MNTLDYECTVTGRAVFKAYHKLPAKEAFQGKYLHLIELLVHFTLGVNFQTKTRPAREWVCSCPKQLLSFMLLFSTVKIDCGQLHGLPLWLHQVGKHRSTTDSIAFKNATWFQAAHRGSKGGVLWGQEMTNSNTASRQSVFTRLLNQLAKSSGSSSYILMFTGIPPLERVKFL